MQNASRRSWNGTGAGTTACSTAASQPLVGNAFASPAGLLITYRDYDAGPVVGGVREGVWRFYHPGGALAKEGPYVRGKREGEWVLYDDAGAVVARERYELDVRVE